MVAQIFFSYSNSDRDIVEVYLDTLVRCGMINREEVFCFERPGAQGTAGRLISKDIQDAIAAPVAIAVISESYLRSHYCIAEFGHLRFSAVAGGSCLIPLLVPPLTSETVSQFFRDVGLVEGYSSSSALNSLLDLTARSLRKFPNYSVWESARAEAAARLDAVLATRPKYSDSGIELCDLDASTLGKILAVREGRLSSRERRWFYTKFQELEPQYHVPVAPVAPASVQAGHEHDRPIDDTVLTGLGKAFDVDIPQPSRPLGAQLKQSIQDAVPVLSQAIFEFVRSGELSGNPHGNRALAFRRLYDYLSALDVLANREELSGTDIILVPGARKGHVFRADEAVRVARLSPNISLIVFSGGHPIFDGEQDLPFGEADALVHRFRLQYPRAPSQITLRVDNRARTTQETISHLRVHLQPLVADIGRPVTLTLVTSPYHMRRLYYLSMASFGSMSHLVDRVQGSLSNASFDWGVIAHPRSGQEPLARYGIGLFVLELAKLYGGRATAEF